MHPLPSCARIRFSGTLELSGPIYAKIADAMREPHKRMTTTMVAVTYRQVCFCLVVRSSRLDSMNFMRCVPSCFSFSSRIHRFVAAKPAPNTYRLRQNGNLSQPLANFLLSPEETHPSVLNGA